MAAVLVSSLASPSIAWIEHGSLRVATLDGQQVKEASLSSVYDSLVDVNLGDQGLFVAHRADRAGTDVVRVRADGLDVVYKFPESVRMNGKPIGPQPNLFHSQFLIFADHHPFSGSDRQNISFNLCRLYQQGGRSFHKPNLLVIRSWSEFSYSAVWLGYQEDETDVLIFGFSSRMSTFTRQTAIEATACSLGTPFPSIRSLTVLSLM